MLMNRSIGPRKNANMPPSSHSIRKLISTDTRPHHSSLPRSRRRRRGESDNNRTEERTTRVCRPPPAVIHCRSISSPHPDRGFPLPPVLTGSPRHHLSVAGLPGLAARKPKPKAQRPSSPNRGVTHAPIFSDATRVQTSSMGCSCDATELTPPPQQFDRTPPCHSLDDGREFASQSSLAVGAPGDERIDWSHWSGEVDRAPPFACVGVGACLGLRGVSCQSPLPQCLDRSIELAPVPAIELSHCRCRSAQLSIDLRYTCHSAFHTD